MRDSFTPSNRAIMQSKRNVLSQLFFVFAFLYAVSGIHAATITSTATGGNWGTGGTWVGGTAPASGDSVIIAGGATVTVDGTYSCRAVFFLSAGNTSSLTFSGSNSLTVTNDVTFSTPASNAAQTLAVATGNLSCANLILVNTGNNAKDNNVTISTGSLTISGNLTMPGSSSRNSFTATGAGTVTIGGTWSNSGSLTLGTAKYIYSGSSAQSVLAGTYQKLTFSGSGNKTLAGAVVVTDTFTISPGATLNNSGSTNLTTNGVFYIQGTYTESNTGGSVTFNGLVHVATGGAFNATVNESFTFTNGLTVDGTFTSGSGTYTFSTNAQSIKGKSTKTFGGNVTINTTVTNYDSVIVTGNLTGSGNFTNGADSAYLELNGGTISVTTLTATTSGNTVVYGRSGTQTVKSTTYHNLIIQNSGGTKTAGGAITINGALTVSSGVTFDMSTQTLSGSSMTTSGTGTMNTQSTSGTPIPAGITWTFTVAYNSGSAQTIVSGNYATLNGTGGNRTLSTTGTVGISATFTVGSGTYTVTSSTVDFNGTTQSIPAFTFNNLTCSNSGTKTASAITVNGALSIASGVTLSMGSNLLSGSALTTSGSSSGLLTTSNTSSTPIPTGRTWTFEVSYNSSSAQTIVNGSYASLTASGGNRTLSTNTINISGVFTTGSGTYTVTSSTVNFNGAAQTIPAFTFNNLTVSGSRLKTMSGAVTVGGALAFASATDSLSLSGQTLTLNGTITGLGGFVGSTSSSMTIGGSGALGTFIMMSDINLLNLTINRSTSGTVTLGSNLTIASGGTLALTNGALQLNGFTLTINGDMTSSSGTITGSSSSGLSFGGSGTVSSNINFTSGAATLGSFTTNRISGVVTLGTDASFTNATFTTGALVLNGKTLSLSGTVTTTSGTITGSSTSNISITGTGAMGTLAFTSGSTALNTLTINRTSTGSVTLGSSLTLSGTLTLTAGMLNVGANTLTLNSSFSGSASGALSGNGSSSNITIAGSGSIGNLFFDQTTSGTTNRFNNLTINRSSQTITLGNALELTGTFTPTAGTLATGNVLTLVSNASGSARVAAGSGTYITGNVIVERYIPAVARRWRFMGSPVSGSTLADFQGEIYITGTGGATNGFDATSSNSASVYTYDETVTTGDLNTGWTAATNITNALTVGKGVRVFVRGDRSDAGRLSGSNSTQNAVTLNLINPLNTGNVTMPITYTSSGTAANDGWNFVSNPYASAYDWNAFYDAQNGTANCTNIDPSIYILDAASNNYVAYNAASDAGTLTGGIIPPFGGFMIKATAASPALILTETYKTATSPVSVFKTNEGEGFTMRLEADSISYDQMVIKYMNGSTENKDMYDINKLTGALVNISAYGSDSIQLSASVRPVSNYNDTIRLSVKATTTGTYKLKFFNSSAIAVQEQVLLFDTYAGQVIDLKTTSEYNFTITTTIAATQGLSRFYIVVGNTSSLPVKWTSFTARKTDKGNVKVQWATATEINNDHFEVQRSLNAKDFETIGTAKGAGSTTQVQNYSFMDETPAKVNYYRVKQVNADGTFEYSSIRVVELNETAEIPLVLFPVPVVKNLTVQHTQNSMITGCSVFDIDGKLVLTQQQQGQVITVNMEQLETGVYFVQITDETGSTYTERIVKD